MQSLNWGLFLSSRAKWVLIKSIPFDYNLYPHPKCQNKWHSKFPNYHYQYMSKDYWFSAKFSDAIIKINSDGNDIVGNDIV